MKGRLIKLCAAGIILAVRLSKLLYGFSGISTVCEALRSSPRLHISVPRRHALCGAQVTLPVSSQVAKPVVHMAAVASRIRIFSGRQDAHTSDPYIQWASQCLSRVLILPVGITVPVSRCPDATCTDRLHPRRCPDVSECLTTYALHPTPYCLAPNFRPESTRLSRLQVRRARVRVHPATTRAPSRQHRRARTHTHLSPAGTARRSSQSSRGPVPTSRGGAAARPGRRRGRRRGAGGGTCGWRCG